MNGVVSVIYITTLLGGAELDTHATLAIVRRLAGPSAADVALEMLSGARVAVGVAVFVLHAVLANVAEARALAVLGGPSVVEAVAEAVDLLDRLNDTPGRGTLDNGRLARVDDVDHVADQRARMPLPTTLPLPNVAHVGSIDPLELRGQVVLPTLRVGSYARTDQLQHSVGGQRQL